jgi:small subunit ribosomal protein S4
MKYQKKKFARPQRPWDKARLESERELLNEFGLRRKHELWRSQAILRDWRQQARNLAAKHDKAKEAILITRLSKLGLVNENASLDSVLALTVEEVLKRRLQSCVMRKGIAGTAKQARQYITHGHIAIEGRRVKWPSTLLTPDEEKKIMVYEKSKLKGWTAKPSAEGPAAPKSE